jgi:serine/threonine protein kinase
MVGEIEKSDIENEVHAINKLCKRDGHPNIIIILDHGWLVDDHLYFIDMELCDLSLHQYIYAPRIIPEGWEAPGDLSFIVTEGSGLQNIANVWAILSQISEGLAYIHAQDLVHRDMKPRNSNPHYQ